MAIRHPDKCTLRRWSFEYSKEVAYITATNTRCLMAVINRPDRDIQRARQLRLTAAGKLPVTNMWVKTPHGRLPVKQVVRLDRETYRLVV